MSSTPQISIVITTFNRDSLLAETLTSLVHQTITPHEVIVVDDGSPNANARKIVNSFAPFARYVWQHNQGMQVARNTGIAHATGDWIAFLDDDDLWEPDRYELILRLATSGLVNVISGNFRKFGDGWIAETGYFEELGRRYPSFWSGITNPISDSFLVVKKFPTTRLIPEHPFWPSTLVVKRELINEIGGWNPTLSGIKSEDIDFVFRVVKHGKLGLIWKPTLRYRSHSGNEAGTGLKVQLGRIHVWEHILKQHELTGEEHHFITDALMNMRSEALWIAFTEKNYTTVLEMSEQINRTNLSLTKYVKILIAKLLTRVHKINNGHYK